MHTSSDKDVPVSTADRAVCVIRVIGCCKYGAQSKIRPKDSSWSYNLTKRPTLCETEGQSRTVGWCAYFLCYQVFNPIRIPMLSVGDLGPPQVSIIIVAGKVICATCHTPTKGIMQMVGPREPEVPVELRPPMCHLKDKQTSKAVRKSSQVLLI